MREFFAAYAIVGIIAGLVVWVKLIADQLRGDDLEHILVCTVLGVFAAAAVFLFWPLLLVVTILWWMQYN